MVSYSDINTSNKRREYTKKNTGTAIIKRKDGSIEVVDSSSGKIKKEYSSSGKQRIRLNKDNNAYSTVTSQKAAEIQDQTIKQIEQEKLFQEAQRKELEAKNAFIEANKDKTAKEIFNNYNINIASDGSGYSITPKQQAQLFIERPEQRYFSSPENVTDPLLKDQGTPSFKNVVVFSPPRVEIGRKSPETIFFEVAGSSPDPLPLPRGLDLVSRRSNEIFFQGGKSFEQAQQQAVNEFIDNPKTAALITRGNILDLTPDQRFEAEFNPTLKTWTKQNFLNIGKFQTRNIKKNLPKSKVETISFAGKAINPLPIGFARAELFSPELKKELSVQAQSMLTKEELERQGIYMLGTGAATLATSTVVPLSPYQGGDVIDLRYSVPDIAGGILFPTTSRKATAILETIDLVEDAVPFSPLNINFRSDVKVKPIKLTDPNKGSVAGGGSNIKSGPLNPVVSTRASPELKASEFQTSNAGLTINKNFFDAEVNINKKNLYFNPEVSNKFNNKIIFNNELTNSEVNLNKDFNINKNVDINLNEDFNVNKNIDLNINKNLNKNVNANANINQNVYANVNKNINREFNFSFNPKRKKARTRLTTGSFKFDVGKKTGSFYKEFSSGDLFKGSQRAQKLTDETIAASFGVRRKSGKKLGFAEQLDLAGSLGSNFRLSKKGSRVVERRAARLNSPEELSSLKKSKNPFRTKKGTKDIDSLLKKGFGLRDIRRFLK